MNFLNSLGPAPELMAIKAASLHIVSPNFLSARLSVHGLFGHRSDSLPCRVFPDLICATREARA